MTFEILDKTGADITALKQAQLQYSLQFEREKTALKFYLLGKGYHRAIKALGFIEQLEFRVPPEERFRKDKVTLSLHHQVRIALSATQLKGLSTEVEELCLVCSLLHDSQEDYGIDFHELSGKFGNDVAEACWKLTKKFAGQQKNKEEYVRELSQDLVASMVKGLDRLDNLYHMINVFSINKMDQYSFEAETVFLPMLKTASKLYPELMQAYTDISQKMKRQVGFTKQYVKLAQEADKNKTDLEEKISQLKAAEQLIEEKVLENNDLTKQVSDLAEQLACLPREAALDKLNKVKIAIYRGFGADKQNQFKDLDKVMEEISVILGGFYSRKIRL